MSRREKQLKALLTSSTHADLLIMERELIRDLAGTKNPMVKSSLQDMLSKVSKEMKTRSTFSAVPQNDQDAPSAI